MARLLADAVQGYDGRCEFGSFLICFLFLIYIMRWWLENVMEQGADVVDYVAGASFGGVELGDLHGEVTDSFVRADRV